MIRIYDKGRRYSKVYRRVETFLGEWPAEAYGVLNRVEDLDLVFKAFALSRLDCKNMYVVFDGRRASWRYGYIKIADRSGTRSFIYENEIDTGFSWEEALAYCEENLQEVIGLKPGVWAADPDCVRVDITEELNWIEEAPLRVKEAPLKRKKTLLEEWRQFPWRGEDIYDI